MTKEQIESLINRCRHAVDIEDIVSEAREEAIDALYKKEALRIQYGGADCCLFAYCPTCEKELTKFVRISPNIRYCPFCGQRLET
jgi:hypothetical protein